MSFEAYIQCHNEGDFGSIPIQAVLDCFGEYLFAEEGECKQVVYDNQHSCNVRFTHAIADPNSIRALCVYRPCGDIRLWDSLAAILRIGNVVLYFPADTPPLIADETVKNHLPIDMIEALGEPVVVSSGIEILDILGKL